MFADWYNTKNKFENRLPFRKYDDGNVERQGSIFDDISAEVYNDVFDALSNQSQSYLHVVPAEPVQQPTALDCTIASAPASLGANTQFGQKPQIADR